MKKAKNRVVENLATTLCGLAALGFSAYMMYSEKATTAELAGWFTLGVTLLRAKNSLIPGFKAK